MKYLRAVRPFMLVFWACIFLTSLHAESELFDLSHFDQIAKESVLNFQQYAVRSQSNAPSFIKKKNGRPVMNVAVINRSEMVDKQLLRRILNAVAKQVERDFSPYYGISVSFRIFANEDDVDWKNFVPLVIPDLLVTPTPGAIAFHDNERSTVSPWIQGDPISLWISNPPVLPAAQPYMIIPIGTEDSGYGVFWASLSGDPTLPPTFEGILSDAISHEVLETLGDYTATFAASNTPLKNPKILNFYVHEVCDPVEFAPGYKIDGQWVSNFVLPSFWIWGREEGPFDFLDTVVAPLTPYAGLLQFFKFGPCGLAKNLIIVSLSVDQGGNPLDDFIVDIGLFKPCKGSGKKNANLQAPSFNSGPRIHYHPAYFIENLIIKKEAA